MNQTLELSCQADLLSQRVEVFAPVVLPRRDEEFNLCQECLIDKSKSDSLGGISARPDTIPHD